MSIEFYSNPISPWIYILRNKLKTFALIVIFALSLVTVLIPKTIFKSLEGDFNRYAAFYKKTSIFNLKTYRGDFTSEKLETRLKDSQAISSFMKGSYSYVSVKSIQGAFYQPVVFLNTNDYKTFLEKMDWKLKSGKLPEANTNQIVLSEALAKNKGVEIGDFVGRDVSKANEYLAGKYQISGILEAGASEGSLANIDYLVRDFPNQTPTSWDYFIFPKESDQQKAENLFDEMKKEDPLNQLEIKNYRKEIVFLNDLNKTFDSVNWILNGIITLTLCSVMILLNQINIFLRQSEVGVLLAIGYTKLKLLRRFTLEGLFQISISYILGMLLLNFICFLVNRFFFDPLAISQISPWTPDIFWLSLPLPIISFVSTFVLYGFRFYKIDPVSLIE
jgi:ABC-type lipoprotein release transport system permease subunit